MLDGLSTASHGVRIGVEAPLYSFEHVLILGPRDAPLLACRADDLQHAAAACIGPIAPQRLTVLDIRLTSRLVGAVCHQLADRW